MCGRAAAGHQVLLSRIVMQNAMGEVLKVYPQLKLKIDVDDLKMHVWRVEQ